jgi:hypothetical protein
MDHGSRDRPSRDRSGDSVPLSTAIWVEKLERAKHGTRTRS